MSALAHHTPGPRPRTVAVSRRHAPVAIRLVPVLGLLVLGSLRWAEMLAPQPVGRAWSWVALGTAGALALVLARLVPPRPRVAVALALAAILLLAALRLGGIPRHLLAPSRWDDLLAGVGRGLSALPGLLVPYAGRSAGWPVRVIQTGGALLAVLAVLAAFWPRSHGRTSSPVLAAVLLGVLAGVPAVVLPADHAVGHGLLLLLGLVLLLAGDRLARADAPVAVGAIVLAAVAGVLLFPAVNAARPWFDYQKVAQQLGGNLEHFDWQHSYGPLNWPRTGRELVRVKTGRSAYWKAENLSSFDGLRWRATPSGSPDGADQLDLERLARRHPEWVRSLDVTFRGLGGDRLVAAGGVLSIAGRRHDVSPAESAGTFFSDSQLAEGDEYRFRAYVPAPTPVQLNAAGTRYPPDLVVERAVSLPAAATAIPGPAGDEARARVARALVPVVVPPAFGQPGEGDVYGPRVASIRSAIDHSAYAGVWTIARRLRAHARTPYAYAKAVEAHLARGFTYSEVPPSSPVPLADFILRTHLGYCQQFSGAMALLLRMEGIPARVSAGFAPGTRDPGSGEWVARDYDAHSWVEAYFPGLGWVTFDPTPAASPASGRTDLGIDLSGLGGRRGVGTGRIRDLNLPGGGKGLADQGRSKAGTGFPWLWLLVGAVLLAAAIAAVRARRRRPGAPADAVLAELEQALRRSGRPLPPGTTLAQLERRLSPAPDAQDYVRAVRAVRFAPEAPGPTPGQRRALRRALAQGLGLSGAVRSWWALPPRVGSRRTGAA